MFDKKNDPQDVFPSDVDAPDEDQDGFLERIAGHGTFIAGIVRSICPSSIILAQKVLFGFGDGDDYTIALGIEDALARIQKVPGAERIDLLNLSLSGYSAADEPPLAVESTIANLQAGGTVVVASAGNSASCRKTWPASLPGVISVAALDCSRPAWFSNYGPWVRACAPGVDVVSTFFAFAEPERELGIPGLNFEGWASWSGTSFAAPRVAAAIAKEMVFSGISAQQAAHALIDAPGLFRIPELGTVVNVV